MSTVGEKSSFKILGMGNPLLDISCEVDAAFLEKYDLKGANAILAEPKHLPIFDELKKNTQTQYIPGGAAMNTMRVCQWASQKPGLTSYIGCIGEDDFGRTLQKLVAADGVKAAFKITDEVPTGTCAVLIHEKDRSMVANLSAANKYDPSHLEQKDVWEIVEGAEMFYLSGYFLTVSPESIMKVAKHAAENNKIVCANLSAPFLVEFFKDPMMSVVPYVDYYFGNETEAATWAKVHGLEDSSPESVARHIASLPKVNAKRARTVVLTNGPGATVVATSAGGVQTFTVDKLEDSKIVDLNGAGDAFVAGFMARLIDGKPIEECVNAAHSSAQYIIQRSGTTMEGTPAF
eukprot:57714_1